MKSSMTRSRNDPRAKGEKDTYYKGKYYITFYQKIIIGGEEDERFYAGFNNVVEICNYKKWPLTTNNINRIHQILYKALDSDKEHITRLIDDIPLKIYLIDMSEEIKENERREKEMKKFVKISSTISIEVHPNLSAKDTTNLAAHMADRLGASPSWVCPILIRKGIHFYPTEIKSWKAVKALEKKQLLSISEEAEEVPAEEKEICAKMKEDIEKYLRSQPQPEKKTSKPTTEEVA